EQNDVSRRPNLPANEYWASNKDNTFRKDNRPATGTLPAAAAPIVPKTGTLPEMSTPKPANQSKIMESQMSNKQYNNRPSVTVPIMGGGAMSPDVMPQASLDMARADLLPMGTPDLVRATQLLTPTGVQGVLTQPSGSMLPPGAYATCDMAQMPGQEPGSVQSRCGRVSDLGYIQGFLRTQIGRHVKIEFVVGTNMFIDREGYLVDVGIDYLIINETNTDDYLLCDMYSIKFVKIYF
ncbi:MAG TPA: hypothetical protein DDZ89_13805, partial [Clostridiales bacterium]|nr:hypothetical protein [Clostridiales bacterium]